MSSLWRRLFPRRSQPAPGPPADQPASVSREVPSPVSRERIEKYLKHNEYHFEVDNDGDLTGVWDGNQLWFLLLGTDAEVLQVRGRWHNALGIPNKLGALRAINDWNRDRIWPKVYLRDEDPGPVLYAEVSVDLEHGVTDAQLAQYLSCGIATSTMMLGAVTRMLTPPA